MNSSEVLKRVFVALNDFDIGGCGYFSRHHLQLQDFHTSPPKKTVPQKKSPLRHPAAVSPTMGWKGGRVGVGGDT